MTRKHVEAAPATDAAPDFAQLAAQATGDTLPSGTSATALDDLARDLARPTTELSDADFAAADISQGENRTPADDPAPRRRDTRRRHDIPSGRPRGRPRKYAPGEEPARTGEPRQTKAELAAENEQLRARLDAAEARADTDKVAELATSFRMLAHVGFALVAEARGPHWRLNDSEEKTLGETFATAAAPHAEAIESQLPWVAPVLALVGVVGKRIVEDARIRRLSPAPDTGIAQPAGGTGPV